MYKPGVKLCEWTTTTFILSFTSPSDSCDWKVYSTMLHSSLLLTVKAMRFFTDPEQSVSGLDRHTASIKIKVYSLCKLRSLTLRKVFRHYWLWVTTKRKDTDVDEYHLKSNVFCLQVKSVRSTYTRESLSLLSLESLSLLSSGPLLLMSWWCCS